MGDVIRAIVVGLLVGAAARFVYPGPVQMGWIGSIVLGIAGSYLGSFVGRLLGRGNASEPLQPAGCLGSILGAVLLIFLARHLFHLV